MHRAILYIGILLLNFVFGVAVTSVTKWIFPADESASIESSTPLDEAGTVFIPGKTFVTTPYRIYWFRTANSKDPEQLSLYGDFRSADVTHDLFESYSSGDNVKLIECGPKSDLSGEIVGKRCVSVVMVGPNILSARVFWTDRGTFWTVFAPSVELVRAFEASDVVQSITYESAPTDRALRLNR